MPASLDTIHGRVARAREQLRAAGIAGEEADLDARVLAQFVLGWDAARLLTAGGEPADSSFLRRYDGLIARRTLREPIAYLTGSKEFWNLTFEVCPAVLIPRPETELLVEAVLDRFPEPAMPFAMADVCTGSGCVAIALAKERPEARLVATDLSGDALAVAVRNARRHGVDRRIQFRQTDVLQDVSGTFDVIVANPPYVPEHDRAAMQPEVRDYEPPLALFGGADGLSVVRRLLDQSAPLLAPDGSLLFEFGFGQEDDIMALISAVPAFQKVDIKRDLQSIPRVAVLRKPRRG
jgi:release factor glutamine methyltransferase